MSKINFSAKRLAAAVTTYLADTTEEADIAFETALIEMGITCAGDELTFERDPRSVVICINGEPAFTAYKGGSLFAVTE